MHHRLLALGIDHPRAVFILYGAGLTLAACALVSMFMSAREAALLVVALLLAGFLGLRRLGYDEFALIRNGTALRVYEAPALNSSMFVVFVDLTIVALAVFAAVVLKTDDWRLAVHRGAAFRMIALLAPITVAVFSRMGLYRGAWRLAGIEDFMRASCAVLVAALLGLSVRMVLEPAEPSVALFSIYALVAVLLVTASRASYQMLQATHRRASQDGAPALIYGAGRKGVTALQQLALDAGAALRPVGFIDDDPEKAGKLVHGIPVLGSAQSVERAIRRLAVRAVIVASDAISDLRLQTLTAVCEQMDVALVKMQITFDHCAGADIVPRLAMATAGAGVDPPSPEVAVASAPARPTAAARSVPASTAALDLRFEAGWLSGRRPSIGDGMRCPHCRSTKLHRSHVNTVSERVRKHLSQKRLYRCEACGWRGWRQLIDLAVFETTKVAAGRVTWESIDATLSVHSAH